MKDSVDSMLPQHACRCPPITVINLMKLSANRNRLGMSGRKVVDDHHLVPRLEKLSTANRAYISCATRHQHARHQYAPLPLITRHGVSHNNVKSMPKLQLRMYST